MLALQYAGRAQEPRRMTSEFTISPVAHLIQLAIAPVFLLTGVGSILSVLTNRMGRIVDRARLLEKNLADANAEEQERIHLELHRLSKRAHLINWAISLSTTCALLICTLIAALFVGDTLTIYMAKVVALLFITAMLSLIGALLCFLREIYFAFQNLRIGLH
jgi:hypothetical protein